MITSIKEIANIGSFERFTFGSNAPTFDRVNLIFGYNGSGKTTLSNVLRLFSANHEGQEELFEELSTAEDAEATIEVNGEARTYEEAGEKEDIYVFNTGFVSDHVYEGAQLQCEQFAEGVVTEEQLSSPEIKKLTARIQKMRERKEGKEDRQQELKEEFEKVKNQFTNDFNQKVPGKRSRPMPEPPEEPPNLNLAEAEEQLEAAYRDYELSQQQAKLKEDTEELKNQKLESLEIPLDRISKLLQQTVSEKGREKVAQRIESWASVELEQTHISLWFQNGYTLLQDSQAREKPRCPLCDRELGEVTLKDLLAEYEAYFSQAYRELNGNIDGVLERLDELPDLLLMNVDSRESLEQFESKYGSELIEAVSPLTGSEQLEERIKQLRRVLKEKKASLEEPFEMDMEDIKQALIDYNEQIEELKNQQEALLTEISGRMQDPDECVDNVKDRVRDCVYAKFDHGEESEQIAEYNQVKSDIERLGKDIQRRERERREEISKLRDESRWVNKYLRKLGIEHFRLGGDGDSGTYIDFLTSGTQTNKLRYSLSESEKTTLALAYFLSKIEYEREQNQESDIGNTIIVVDDPVSSFDTNRLHVTATKVYELAKKAKQIFVLSHNITFMKYFSNLLQDASDIEGERRDYYLPVQEDELAPLPDELRNYTTTYFHKLHELVRFQDGDLDYESAKAYIPVYVRTVLETFLSFHLSVLKEGASNKKYRLPGLGKMINVLKSRIGYFADREEVGEINQETICDVLWDIKRKTDPQAHGSPGGLEELDFIRQPELQHCVKNTLNIIEFLSPAHFGAAIKGS